MIRGLAAGITRQVTATLQERGLSDKLAARLAEESLVEATKFFEGRLATHQMSGKPLELALDDSFVDLGKWAADLAERRRDSSASAIV